MALVGAALAGPAYADNSNRLSLVEGTGVTATLSEVPYGWRVDYVFDRPRRAMLFSRSSYRLDEWTPITEGARIVEVGGFDVMVFDRLRTTASFRMDAHYGRLPLDYTPFLAFSEGGIALFTGQFELLPVDDLADVEALGGDLTRWTGQQPDLGVRVATDRPMLVDGRQASGVAETRTRGSGSYIYLGSGDVVEGRSFVGLIDPGTPDWLKTRLDDDFASIFASLEEEFGQPLDKKATVYLVYEGAEPDGFSFNGGALPDLMMLSVSGSQLGTENPLIAQHLLWFLAHESVHLFQQAVDAVIVSGANSWIHEGGASALANLAVARLSDDRAYLQSRVRSAMEICPQALGGRSLLEASRAGEQQAIYECGMLAALATRAMLGDRDLAGFWTDVAAGTDRQDFDIAVYFDVLAERGASATDVRRLRAFVSRPLASPDEVGELLGTYLVML